MNNREELMAEVIAKAVEICEMKKDKKDLCVSEFISDVKYLIDSRNNYNEEGNDGI